MSSSTPPETVQSGVSAVEQRAVVSLASLYALRMLGLFMVLPVMMI
jgi:hypothetical protein